MTPINSDSFPQVTPVPHQDSPDSQLAPKLEPNQNTLFSNKRTKLVIILRGILLVILVISASAFLLNKIIQDNKIKQEIKQKEADAKKRASTLTVKNDYERIGDNSSTLYPSNSPKADTLQQTTTAIYEIFDGQYYSLYLPTDWTKDEQSYTLTANDLSTVRNIKIVVSNYSQKFVDTWKNASEYKKELDISHARFLTPQCSLDNNFCTRTHFIWNEEQKKFATLTVHWEKAPQTVANIQNGIETDPSVNLFETNLFSNFKFK